jgi:hypothetical protein
MGYCPDYLEIHLEAHELAEALQHAVTELLEHSNQLIYSTHTN